MKVSVTALLVLVVLVHEVVCRRNGSGSNGSKSGDSKSNGSKSSGSGSNGSKSNGNKSSGNRSNGSGSTDKKSDGKKSNDKKSNGESTEVNTKVSTDGKDVKLEGSLKHDNGNGLKVDVGGHVDTQGNIGASVEVTKTFDGRRRRSLGQEKYFTLHTSMNPCDFNLYDTNRDGVISNEELAAVYGDNAKTDELFETLDLFSGDEQVDRDEFTYMISMTFQGC